MGGSSADIEARLGNVNDPDNPTRKMPPAIFRNIVERLDAVRLTYSVVGRIALIWHEQARLIGDIEIVADLNPDNRIHRLARARRDNHITTKITPAGGKEVTRHGYPTTCAPRREAGVPTING